MSNVIIGFTKVQPNCYTCGKGLSKYGPAKYGKWGYRGSGYFCSMHCGVLAGERVLGEMEVVWNDDTKVWDNIRNHY